MSKPDKLKILMVDDRPENLKSLHKLLDRPDLEFLCAESGNDALNIMLDHDLALVLLDVQMPEMDGYEVAELMRRNMRTRHLPIIFVTAINKERRHLFHGYEAGAVDYIFKPVDPFVLRSKVNVFLEIKRHQLAREKLLVELNQTNNRLQEISARKSEFLAAASHELRTPLTVIKEYTSLVLEEVVGPLNKEQKRCLESAHRNCHRLGAMVDDLLDLDCIESGQSRLARGKVELPDLLREMVADFHEKMSQAQQNLELVLDRNAPPVLADPELITQVLYNLLGNAHKFVPADGTITVQLDAGPQGAVVSVADDGPGIGAQDKERVFEKFTRLDRSRGRSKGTGLGLPLSRKVIEMHGGKLALESDQGMGCVFRFELPAYSAEAHREAFVADGQRSVGMPGSAWTLVQVQGFEGDGAEGKALQEAVEQCFRGGEDRADQVAQDGRWRQLVLLRGDREGAFSFLARLQKQLEDLPGDWAALEFSLQPALGEPGDPPPQEFQPLDGGMEKERSLT